MDSAWRLIVTARHGTRADGASQARTRLFPYPTGLRAHAERLVILAMQTLAWLRNAIDFRIRQALRLRRGAVQLAADAKEGLFPRDVAEWVEQLVVQHDLQEWQQQSGRIDFAASLFYMEMVRKGFAEAEVALPMTVQALDCGAGDWFYVQPLYALLTRYGAAQLRHVSLEGVEVDAFALYKGFTSRHDWADAYRSGLSGVRYAAGDVREHHTPVDVAFMFFPFLFADDLRRWGLPRRYLAPHALASHVWGLVKPGGILFIANVGEEEHRRQQALLSEIGVSVTWTGAFESPLFTYRNTRYITVARK